MSMVVRSNINSMNANRNLSKNNGLVSKSLEKLASGYAINRAADDASGLAVSEKMRAQITGLEQGTRNCLEGVCLVQTAEGALNEIHEILNRVSELCVKSANGTIQDEVDREAIQVEVDVLLDEINRIASATNYNGINLLNGINDILSATYHIDGILSDAFITPDAFLNVSSSVGTSSTEYTSPSVSLSESVYLAEGATSVPATGDWDDSDYPYVISMDIYVYNENTSTEGGGSDISIYTAKVSVNSDGTVTGSYEIDGIEHIIDGDYATQTYQTAFDVANGNVGYEYISDLEGQGITESELQVIMCELLNNLSSATGTDLYTGGSLGLSIPADAEYSYNTYPYKTNDLDSPIYETDEETGDKILLGYEQVTDYDSPEKIVTSYPVFDIGSTDPIYPTSTGSYTNEYNGVTSTIDDIGNYVSAAGNFGVISSIQVFQFYVYNDPANDGTSTINSLTLVTAPNLCDYDSYDDYVQDVNHYYDTYGIELDDYMNVKLSVTDTYGDGMRISGGTADYLNNGRTIGVVSTVSTGTTTSTTETNPSDFVIGLSSGDDINGSSSLLGLSELGESVRNETQIPEPITYDDIMEKLNATTTTSEYNSVLASIISENVITITEYTVLYPDTFTDELGEDQVNEILTKKYITVVTENDQQLAELTDLFGTSITVVSVPGVTDESDYHYIIDALADQIGDDYGIRATRMLDDVYNDIPTDANTTNRFTIQLGTYEHTTYEWERDPEDQTFYEQDPIGIIIHLADQNEQYNKLDIVIDDLRINSIDFHDLEGLENLYNAFNSGEFDSLVNSITGDTMWDELKIGTLDELYSLYLNGNLDAYLIPSDLSDLLEVLVAFNQEPSYLSYLENLDVSTQESAGKAIDIVKNAINYVSSTRSSLGAYQNRLEYTINNNNNTSENMTAARSVIKDTDMAKEMMEYTKMDILTQAAQSMLVQTNQAPQAILELLG